MVKYCGKCENLLTKYFTNDIFGFRCMVCNEEVEAQPEDTLLYDDMHNKKDNTLFLELVNNALYDPIAFKKRKPCKFCKNMILKQIRVEPNMELYNACVECQNVWLN